MLAENESLVVIWAPFVVCNVLGDFADILLYVCLRLELFILFWVYPIVLLRSGDAYYRKSICYNF